MSLNDTITDILMYIQVIIFHVRVIITRIIYWREGSSQKYNIVNFHFSEMAYSAVHAIVVSGLGGK